MSRAVPELRVYIVEAQLLVSELLSHALGAEPGIVCVGRSRGLDQAVGEAPLLSVDVIVIGQVLPDEDATVTPAELLRGWPNVRLVMLSDHPAGAASLLTDNHGRVAFVSRYSGVKSLMAVLRGPGQGGESVGNPAAVHARPVNVAHTGRLSPREREVLALLGGGLDATGISRALGLSPHTTRGYLKGVLAKLGAHSQLEAVLEAVRLGLIQLPGSAVAPVEVPLAQSG